MQQNNLFMVRPVVYGVVLVFFSLCAAAKCPDNIMVNASKEYRVIVDANSMQRTLNPSFFGFNLEWIPFQSSLWDANSGKVKSEILEYLRPFSGAVYRYPGGVPANISDWRDLIGDINDRPLRKYASWSVPFKNRFGLSEYLDFLSQVDGQGWYILNMTGHYGEEFTPSALAAEVKGVTDYFNQQHLESGKPEIIKWELGNELDRNPLHWVTDKIIDRSLIVADALPAEVNKGKLVSMLEEYPALDSEGITTTSFNSNISATLGSSYLSDYAMHLYYDGDNNPQPPVPWFIQSVCNAQSVIESLHPGSAYSIWITEHARAPAGAFLSPDWKALWPQTADQQAAISVADMMIAMAKYRVVQGLMLHAIHGSDAPWPLFHKNSKGVFYPSTVLLVLSLLRESMLPNVLSSSDFSDNRSNYVGGYDMRSVVMSDPSTSKFSVWLINRSDAELSTTIQISALSNQQKKLTLRYISGRLPTDSNYPGSGTHPMAIESLITTINFDKNGSAVLKIPQLAVVVAIID